MTETRIISISLPEGTINKLVEEKMKTGLSISSLVNMSVNKMEISFRK